MIDLRVLLPLALVSCMQSHDDKRVAVRGEDCVTCHLADYDATSQPPHALGPSVNGPVEYPKTCGDCHRTTSWQRALAPHPAPPRFPIAEGPHVAIKCLACHDLDGATAVAGADTNCIQCHPDTDEQRDIHTGLRGPAGQSYADVPTVASFCLSCHPDGLAKLKHPNDRFPRTGPHASSCTSCHDRASGLPDLAGLNTTCITGGCHSLAKEDDNHREEDEAEYLQKRGDGSNRHFCLDCHPDGRKDD